METYILGLVGPTGSGKTTLARQLVLRRGFVARQIGRPIKDMIKILGLSEEAVGGSPAQRIAPQAVLGGKSARYALSTLGTDWGRYMISPDIWSNVLEREIRPLLDSGPAPKIVIDDLRYPSDWSLIRKLGGRILSVRRSSAGRERTAVDIFYYRLGIARILKGRGLFGWNPIHESEFHWPDAPTEGVIWNTGREEELADVALRLLKWN
jgi:energy-coupling factor transporter ATP-binding protein EcfA2